MIRYHPLPKAMLPGRYHPGEGVILHGGCRQAGKITGCGIVFLRVKAMGVGKVGILQAKLLRPRIHPPGKGFDAAAVGNGKGSRRVIAGLEHHAIEQVLHTDLFSRFEINA